MKFKKVFLANCKIGDKFKNIYYPNGQSICGSTVYTITNIDDKYIAVKDNWNFDIRAFSKTENIQVDLLVKNDNTKLKKVKEVIIALQHQLYDQGDATHELLNTWVCALDPYDMVETLEKHNLTIVGYFYLTEPKMRLDIGVVAEDKDGERIWCHARKAWFDDWKEEYPELYN